MSTIVRPALVLFAALTVICGVVYPFATAGIGQPSAGAVNGSDVLALRFAGSGSGEGNVYLGFVEVTTDASGHASIGATLAAAGLAHGAWVTATATEKTGASTYGSTSEFAANVQAANTAPVLTVPANAATTENAAPVVLAPAATVVDTELAAAGSYAGATLTLARSGGANAQDVFSASKNGFITGMD